MSRTFDFSVMVEDTISLELPEDVAAKLDEVLKREGSSGPYLMLDDLPGEIHPDLIDRLNGEMQILDISETSRKEGESEGTDLRKPNDQ